MGGGKVLSHDLIGIGKLPLMGSINDHRIDYMGGRGDSRKPVAHTQ